MGFIRLITLETLWRMFPGQKLILEVAVLETVRIRVLTLKEVLPLADFFFDGTQRLVAPIDINQESRCLN